MDTPSSSVLSDEFNSCPAFGSIWCLKSHRNKYVAICFGMHGCFWFFKCKLFTGLIKMISAQRLSNRGKN